MTTLRREGLIKPNRVVPQKSEIASVPVNIGTGAFLFQNRVFLFKNQLSREENDYVEESPAPSLSYRGADAETLVQYPF